MQVKDNLEKLTHILPPVQLIVTNDQDTESSILDKLNYVNVDESRPVEEFYQLIRQNKVVYGETETINAIQCGQVKTVLWKVDKVWSNNEYKSIDDLVHSFGSNVILIHGTTTVGQTFIREFGGVGGILRYVYNDECNSVFENHDK